jgi:WD repeat-containing protein 17
LSLGNVEVFSLSLQAAASELEMTKMTRNGPGVKSRSLEDQLREAAEIHVKIGNIMQYCELMMQVGEVMIV